MTTNPDISSFIAAMIADRCAEVPEVHPIDPRGQALELRDRFRRATAITIPLVPGMLCREKRGMGMFRSERLAMFWRWLVPADAQDATIIGEAAKKQQIHRTDCIVGYLGHDGDLHIMYFESWRLEPCDSVYPEDPT